MCTGKRAFEPVLSLVAVVSTPYLRNLYMMCSHLSEQPLRRMQCSLFVGVCLLIPGCTDKRSTDTTLVSPPKTAQEAMTEDLHQYHDMVVAGWAYLESNQALRGIDVSDVRDSLLSRVDAGTDAEQFARLLQEYAAALQDGHAQVDVSAMVKSLTRTWPIGFGVVQEGIVVVNLNWLKDNPGIQLGDQLLAVNGEQIETRVVQAMQVTSASTEHSRRVLAVDSLHRTADETVRFSLKRSDGSLFEVTLPCLAHHVDYRFRARKNFCEHTELDSDIHLIRIPQFTWNEEEFSQATTDREREVALTEAKSQIDSAFSAAENAAGIILDLRGNAGGYELLSSFVAEHLVPDDFLYYSITRRDSEFVRSLKVYAGLDAGSFGSPLPTRPRQWAGFRHFNGAPFNGRLVVLINHRCFSTTDNLCAFLRDSRPNTRFVGQPTGAGTGEPMTVGTLNHSKVPVQFCVSVVHSPKGRLIEGIGTSPDVFVEPTRDDLVQGRDPALAAATEQLRHWGE